MENLTFMKDKHGENNALGDSEVQDGNELQELEKEHSSIMEANNDFDDALKDEIDELKAANEQKAARIIELTEEVEKL